MPLRPAQRRARRRRRYGRLLQLESQTRRTEPSAGRPSDGAPLESMSACVCPDQRQGSPPRFATFVLQRKTGATRFRASPRGLVLTVDAGEGAGSASHPFLLIGMGQPRRRVFVIRPLGTVLFHFSWAGVFAEEMLGVVGGKTNLVGRGPL